MKQQNIVISNATPKTNKSSMVSLYKFLNIISKADSKDCVLLSGDVDENFFKDLDVKICSVNRKRHSNKIISIINYFLYQIKAGFKTLKIANKKSKVFFWIADGMLIPYLIAKLKGAEIYYFIYGNPDKIKTDGSSEHKTAKRICYFANHAKYVCAENIKVFDEWGDRIKNTNRKVIHLYSPVRKIEKDKKDIIGMLCRVSAGKYVKESMEAFKKFSLTNPTWKMEIIGNGPLTDECQQYILDNDLSDKIKMYGWVDPDSKWAIMKSWKYLLFPTDTEGVSNTLLESMGIGVPAIASGVSSVLDIVTPNENGFYLEDNTPDGIYKSLCMAIDFEDYKKLSKSAYLYIDKNYSLEESIRVAKEAIID